MSREELINCFSKSDLKHSVENIGKKFCQISDSTILYILIFQWELKLGPSLSEVKFERGTIRLETSVNRALEVSSVENIKYAGNVENFRGSKQF